MNIISSKQVSTDGSPYMANLSATEKTDDRPPIGFCPLCKYLLGSIDSFYEPLWCCPCDRFVTFDSDLTVTSVLILSRELMTLANGSDLNER